MQPFFESAEEQVLTQADEQEQKADSKSKTELDGQEKTTSSINSNALELKVTKADNTRVRVEMWDNELGKVMGVEEGESLAKAARVIRTFCLRWWGRRVTRSFSVGRTRPKSVREQDQTTWRVLQSRCRMHWWAVVGRAVCCDWWSARDARHYEDLHWAKEAVERSTRASWFEWLDGLTPAHWRWPDWCQPTARNGLSVRFEEAPKQWRRPQSPGATDQIHEQMKSKLSKVRD